MRIRLNNLIKEIKQSTILHFKYDGIEQTILISKDNKVLKKSKFQKHYQYIQLNLDKQNTSYIIALYEALSSHLKAVKDIKLLLSEKG